MGASPAVDKSVNCTLKGTQPVLGVASKLEIGSLKTVIVFVIFEVWLPLKIVSVTLYVPGARLVLF